MCQMTIPYYKTINFNFIFVVVFCVPIVNTLNTIVLCVCVASTVVNRCLCHRLLTTTTTSTVAVAAAQKSAYKSHSITTLHFTLHSPAPNAVYTRLSVHLIVLSLYAAIHINTLLRRCARCALSNGNLYGNRHTHTLICVVFIDEDKTEERKKNANNDGIN